MLKAMVVERNDFWFMDDGALTYHICEDDSPMATPPVVEPCTACDEAKYEVLALLNTHHIIPPFNCINLSN